jgi:hypothetical protein
MADTLDPLVRELVGWIGHGRPYLQVMDAWKTSCPRLPVWEEALQRGLLTCSRDDTGVEWVHCTATGQALLRHSQPTQAGAPAQRE